MDTTYHSGSVKSAKWVCPNDRQLALRAKLKTGWSVKSSSLDSRYDDYSQYSSSYPGNLSSPSSTANANKNTPLTDDERQRIIEVIQRAEALDQSEQERVGKLVERLDNIKRNVSLVTSTRSNGRNCGSRCVRGNRCICCCALCGEKFTVLGAGSNLCRDCRKYVCQKCGIETTTAAIMPITNTKNIQIERDQRPISASVSNLTSLDSLMNVNQQSLTPPTKVFLCCICTETREMWKKSGAWFFKSLPKYILPEKKKPRSGLRCATWTLTGSSRSLEPAENQDSSSDEDLARGNLAHRGLFASFSVSSDTTESPSNQKRLGTHAEIHNRRGSSLDLNTALIDNEMRAVSLQLQPSMQNLPSPSQLIVPNSSSTLISPTSPHSSTSPLSPSRSTNRLRDQRDKSATTGGSFQSSSFYRQFTIGSSESVDRESITDSATKKVLSSHNISGNSSSDKINQTRGVGSTVESTDATNYNRHQTAASRRQSINSDSSLNEIMDSGRMCISRSSSSSQYDHEPNQLLVYRQTEMNQTGMDEEKSYGTLEIALRYEPTQISRCTLQCKLIRARSLRPMDIHGLADPFCMLNILPIEIEKNLTMRLRSKTVHKTRDPEFNEQLNFYEITENDMMSEKALHVMILQDDEAGRDFLGEAKFPLRELRPYQTKFYNVSLTDHYPVDQEESVWGEEMSNGRGKIFLSLSYNTRRRALLVHIQRAMNLLAMDSNGLSDPFVKVSLLMTAHQRDENPIKTNQVQVTKSLRESFTRSITKHHQSKQGKKLTKNTLPTHTTKVKWNTLNPEWNEEFQFETSLDDLTALALVLTVWDKDFGKKNDFLGSLVLSCTSKGARLRQWIDVMKFPDQHHEASHELTKEMALYE